MPPAQKPIEAAPAKPPVIKALHEEESDTPLGDWQTESKGVVRIAHVAFRAPDHAAIKRFHAEGLKAGGRDNGGAGPRADYSPTYFAAFLIDPDGNNVEAVCA